MLASRRGGYQSHTIVWAVLVCLLLSGCTARSRIERGDKAMLADRYAEALNHYRTALRRDRDLAEDPAFTAKLARARAAVHLKTGRARLAQGRWPEAVAALQEAVRIDGTFAEAVAALKKARGIGARDLLTQAVAAADSGDLNRAVMLLKQAAALDPDNRNVRDALDSISRKNTERITQAAARFAEGRNPQNELRWKRAAAAYEQTIALNAYHLPARARLVRCNEALDAAAEHYDTGTDALNRKQLDAAIASLDAALKIWPHSPAALRSAAEARRLRTEVERLLTASRRATGRKQWDRAAALAETAWGLYPWYEPLKLQYETAMGDAGAFHFGAGRDLSAEGSAKEAERQFL